MSTIIDNAGLFSEAAFGVDGMQGLNGVTGAGEAHEAAWQQAVDAALGATIDIPLVETLTTDIDSEVSQAAMATSDIKQSHPVSWDRLSMTVASMVAWNMQIGMAGDEAAGVMDTNLVPQGEALSAGLPQPDPVNQEQASLLSLAPNEENVAAAVSAHELQRTLSVAFEPTQRLISPVTNVEPELPQPTTTSTLMEHASAGAALFDEAGENVASGGQSGLGKPTGLATVTLQEDVANVRSATDNLNEQPQMETKELQSQSGDFNQPGRGAALKAANTSDSVTTAVRPGVSQSVADTEELGPIRHVHDSSVAKSRLDMGQERLQGIRAVLSELESQVDLKSLNRPGQEPAQVSATSKPVQSPVAEPQMQQVDKQVRIADVAERPGLALARSGEELKQQNEQPTSELDPAGDGMLDDFQEAPRSVRDARRLAPVDKPVKVGAQVASAQAETGPINTQADVNAAIAGNENAEITLDQEQATEVAVDDAQTIEASEIPELAVQDPSSIDIDIDDSMGTVRLAMTREAEEVNIRLETPQEVLEEYREMRSEMDERLARQGLDLSEFSADSHGETADSEPAEGNKKESNQGDSGRTVRGSQDLAQDGMNARLVNRIV